MAGAAGGAVTTKDKAPAAATKDRAPGATSQNSGQAAGAAKDRAPDGKKPLQQPGQNVLDAARRLGKTARYLANKRELRAFDTRSLPNGPSWDSSKKMPASLQAAYSVAYRDEQKRGSKAPADYELPGLYRRDFELVVPMTFERAQRAYPDQILAMSTALVPLATALTGSGVAERLHQNAGKVAVSLTGLGEGLWRDRIVEVPTGEVIAVPAREFDWVLHEAFIRRTLAPRVAESRDPLLSVLFAHPYGVLVIREFLFNGASGGVAMAFRLVDEAGQALSDLFTDLRADPQKLWRFPGLVWQAARAEGLGSVPGLQLFLTAVCRAHSGAGVLHPLLTFSSVALGILASVFAPPVGVGVLSVTLGGVGLFAQAVDLGMVWAEDTEQVGAAKATGFQVEEARLGSLDWSRTALAGSMLLLSAIAFFLGARGPRAGKPVGGAPKEPAPSGPRWTSPRDEAAATTAASRGAARPQSGAKPPPGAEQPPSGTTSSPVPGRSTAVPPDSKTAPTTGPRSTEPPPAPTGPSGAPATQEVGPTTPSKASPPVGTRSLPSDQPSVPHTPEQRAAASGVGPPPAAEETAAANTSLAGARGTATSAVDAERKALTALREVTANPVHETVNTRITELTDELAALPEPGAAESAARFRVLQKGMQDEELIASVFGRIQAETELVGTTPAPHEELVGLSTPQERAVARLAGYREGMTVHPTTKDEPLFYEDFVLKEPIIIDPAFANGHGQMIHTTHDLIAAASFEREGIALTGFQWRKSLNNPALSPRAQALQKKLWEEIFDSLEVAPNARGDNVGTLNRPETLNPILDQILGGLNKPPGE